MSKESFQRRPLSNQHPIAKRDKHYSCLPSKKRPPWAEPTRYIENSPILYADRVQTPVMIIQGDIDYISIGQGEEFFMALYRQGKRARFVRYWGEGHSIDSPANIRDQWGQVFGWLDEHLKPTSETRMR